MRLRGWYRSWQRRRRWKNAVRRQSAPLREFVYLDDVSVYSLYASRKGPIATELTETEATSLQSEVTASAGINAVGGKAEVGSRMQTENTRGTQVLRKSIVQTTFKELYDLEQPSLVLRPAGDEVEPAPHGSVDDLRRAAESGEFDRYVIDPTSLKRGALVEMEVQLEAEPIFHAGAVMSGVLDIIQDKPEMYGVHNLTDFSDARTASRMLDKLLGGLMPVRGRALEYEVLELDGKDLLVRHTVLAQLDGVSALRTRPLLLTGVAEQSLFWKDIRRVLFAGSRYRVLARLSRDGLQETWTPVKLVDVLRSVAPDVAATIDGTNRVILAAMSGAGMSDPDKVRSEMMRDALVAYGLGLAETIGHALDARELTDAGVVENYSPDSFRSVISRRKVFAEVTRFIEDRLHVEVNRATAADCRIAALIETGFTPDGQVPTSSPAAARPARSSRSEERFLDSELIAIYW